MNLLHGVGDFFAIDIGTNSIRLVQLNGDLQRGWALTHYAYVPVDAKLTQDSSALGKRRLGETILGASSRRALPPKMLQLACQRGRLSPPLSR